MLLRVRPNGEYSRLVLVVSTSAAIDAITDFEERSSLAIWAFRGDHRRPDSRCGAAIESGSRRPRYLVSEGIKQRLFPGFIVQVISHDSVHQCLGAYPIGLPSINQPSQLNSHSN
jgi:hypothetical protein